MEEKTIKQVADELGVSKDRVKYLVKKLPSEWVNKRGKITYLNSEGTQHIYALLGKNRVNSPVEVGKSGDDSPPLSPVIEVLQATINTLQEQLNVKDEQIRGQQAQIEQLTKALQQQTAAAENTTAALTAAQALHAGTIQERLTVAQDQTEEDPVRSKRSLFSRLFKRSN